MLLLSQDGCENKGRAFTDPALIIRFISFFLKGRKKSCESEHKEITIKSNAEYDGTHQQREDHLIRAKLFHKDLNWEI